MVTNSRTIIRNIGIQIMADIKVTQSIFVLIFGFSGAEAGVPSVTFPISSCVFILSGKIMNKIKLFWELYYPVVLAFLSFLYSVSLWFTGNKLEGIFVGICLGILQSWLIFLEISKELEGATFSVPIGEVGVLIAATVIASILASVIPANEASKIYPAEALRYE